VIGLRVSAAILLAASAALSGGCVRRTLDVTSEPPGAAVVINGHDAGTTPVRVAFRHHGTYRIELRKDGYEPVIAGAPVPRKLYEIEGADLIAEVLWPGVIVDERRIHYKLAPSRSLGTEEKERLLAAGRQAAEDAERLIPKLFEAPAPNPDAKDRRLLPKPTEKDEGKEEGEKGKEDRGGANSPPPGKKPDRPEVD